MQTTGDIAFTRTDSNNFSFVGVLGVAGWKVDTTGSLNLLGSSSYQNAVTERLKSSKKRLWIGDVMGGVRKG